MENVSYDDIINHKKLTPDQIKRDLGNLLTHNANENRRSMAGNKVLYHFQMDNLCRTTPEKKKSLYDVMNDPETKARLVRNAINFGRTGTLPNRMFEANRMNCAVVFFKPTTAMYVYKKYGATKVLDPTAGWGGRLLGAWALGIDYTGIDTNTDLMAAYDGILQVLPDTTAQYQMIFDSCLDADFSTIDYDFVLTSPPYINVELYPNMTPFESKEAYYKKFLIPLLNKCRAHIKPGGRVCFNISPKMYVDLLIHGYPRCDESENLLQQKRLGKDKEDKIYIWRS